MDGSSSAPAVPRVELQHNILPDTLPGIEQLDPRRLASNVRRTRPSRPGRSLRVLLYSHDTFGLGHLRRNLAIAEHLLQRDPPFEVMLLSGSPVASSWPLPTRLELSVMPPVVKAGAEHYVARDGVASFVEVRRQREAVIVQTIRRFRPDVFLVDHAPAGMKRELLVPLSLIRTSHPQMRTILGLRDILDDGPTVRGLWHEQGTYDLLRWAYDHVLVYGLPWLFDVAQEYALPADLGAKLLYCGHVARAPVSTPPARSPNRPNRVLVTVGGGGDGYPLIDTYLRALDLLPVPPAHTTIVSGPLMAGDQHDSLATRAAEHPNVEITRSTAEMSRVMDEADVIVTMAGYNTSVEILAARKPAILIPRAAPRAEQRIRAEMLARMGLAWVVPPDENAVATLAECLIAALSGARPAHLDEGLVDLNGARRTGDIIAELVDAQAHLVGEHSGSGE